MFSLDFAHNQTTNATCFLRSGRILMVFGLSARRDVVITESQAEFDLHRDSLLAELAPQGPMESILADRIVTLSWRLKRAEQIQNQTIDAMHEKTNSSPLSRLAKSLALKGLTTPDSDPADSDPALTLGRIALKDFAGTRVLDRLLMYERRIEYSLFKTTQELQRLHLLRNLEPEAEVPPHPESLNRPESSTSPRIAQNKANLANATTITNLFPTKDYENEPPQRAHGNKPNFPKPPGPLGGGYPAGQTQSPAQPGRRMPPTCSASHIKDNKPEA